MFKSAKKRKEEDYWLSIKQLNLDVGEAMMVLDLINIFPQKKQGDTNSKQGEAHYLLNKNLRTFQCWINLL